MINFKLSFSFVLLGRLICSEFNGLYMHGMASIRVQEVDNTLVRHGHIYVQLDALRAITRASLRVRVLNTMKTNKRIRTFQIFAKICDP